MSEMQIQPVVTAWSIGKCMSTPASYQDQANRYGTVSKKRTAAFALTLLAEARAKDEAQAAANLIAMQMNAAIKARVEALMVEIGMPAKVTEVGHKSRSRFPKRVAPATVTVPPKLAWVVGSPGEFNWETIRAYTREEAEAIWLDDQCCGFCGDEGGDPLECECRGIEVEATRVPQFDGITQPTPGDWIRAGIGHVCCRCSYETDPEFGGRAVGAEAVCEDCMTRADYSAIGEPLDEES